MRCGTPGRNCAVRERTWIEMGAAVWASSGEGVKSLLPAGTLYAGMVGNSGHV